MKYVFISIFLTRNKQLNVLSFISNIGGNFGLFIGISFLSFVEIIQFVLEMAYLLGERVKIFDQISLN